MLSVEPTGAEICAAPHEHTRNAGVGKASLQGSFSAGLDATAAFLSSKTACPAILPVGLGCRGLAALGGPQTGAFPKCSTTADFIRCRCSRRGDGYRSVQISFASPIETNRFHSFQPADFYQLRERLFLCWCPGLRFFSVEIYERRFEGRRVRALCEYPTAPQFYLLVTTGRCTFVARSTQPRWEAPREDETRSRTGSSVFR